MVYKTIGSPVENFLEEIIISKIMIQNLINRKGIKPNIMIKLKSIVVIITKS